MTKLKKIWLDGDACPKPIKESLLKIILKHNIPFIVVANSPQTLPLHSLIHFVLVGKKLDEADQYIIDHVAIGELVITADIPLAAKIVEKGAMGLNPRGTIYDENNVFAELSMRNFMKDLRDGGEITGGPSSYSKKDFENFSNSLNKILQSQK